MLTQTIDFSLAEATGKMLIHYSEGEYGPILHGWSILQSDRYFNPDDHTENLTWLALSVLQ